MIVTQSLRTLFAAVTAPGRLARRTRRGSRHISSGTRAAVAACAVLVSAGSAWAADRSVLRDVSVMTLPGDRLQLEFAINGPVPEPTAFTIDNPARIALDLPGTSSQLNPRSRTLGVGAARSVTAVEANGRTRVVVNLSQLVPYEVTTGHGKLQLVLGGTRATGPSGQPVTATRTAAAGAQVSNVDFRRGEQGEGRLIVSLSDPGTVVDLRQQGKQIIAELHNIGLPEELERRLDVVDFATPVRTVDTFAQGGNVRLVLDTLDDFDYVAYQVENQFTVDVKPVAKERGGAVVQQAVYTGEKLSLNFQDIEVRGVLQLLADFQGLNLVASDSVSGNVTLLLRGVPADQAMDIVLKARGLGVRQAGNVLMVAPAEEIAQRERQDLEARRSIDELAPLRSETIQINYAKAEDIAALLKSEVNSLLSERGNVTVDVRTNKLLLLDTREHLDAVRQVVVELDVPVRQVLIESRVVLASNDFSRELGVRFGATARDTRGNTDIGVSGNIISADTARQGNVPSLPGRLNVNLPVSNLSDSAGAVGLAVANLGRGILLDLELSAAQAEGRSETVSSPRVITANQREAVIKQGLEIPFVVPATANNPPTVQFKEALLSLTVTPQVTPDDRIIMDLKINKDSPDFTRAVQGNPPINTQEVQTQVLVDNGETVVLGGVYEQIKGTSVRRIPFFGDLPLLGALFRTTFTQDDKSELLVFVTPKILKESLTAGAGY